MTAPLLQMLQLLRFSTYVPNALYVGNRKTCHICHSGKGREQILAGVFPATQYCAGHCK